MTLTDDEMAALRRTYRSDRWEESSPQGYRESTFEIVVKMLKGRDIYSVLELGAGRGAVLANLLDAIGAERGVAVEILEEQISLGKELWGGRRIEWVASDLADFRPPMKFDLVVAWSIMLHIPPDRIKTFIEAVERCAGKYFLLVDAEWPLGELDGTDQWHYDHREAFAGWKLVDEGRQHVSSGVEQVVYLWQKSS